MKLVASFLRWVLCMNPYLLWSTHLCSPLLAWANLRDQQTTVNLEVCGFQVWIMSYAAALPCSPGSLALRGASCRALRTRSEERRLCQAAPRQKPRRKPILWLWSRRNSSPSLRATLMQKCTAKPLLKSWETINHHYCWFFYYYYYCCFLSHCIHKRCFVRTEKDNGLPARSVNKACYNREAAQTPSPEGPEDGDQPLPSPPSLRPCQPCAWGELEQGVLGKNRTVALGS